MREGQLVAERYRVREVLGAGGMGAVLRARDEVLGRDVALKLLHAMKGEDALGRFRREGQILARLRHPGLVEVWDYGVEDGQAFIAQEVLEGEDLAARLGRGQLLDPQALRRLAVELADALAYLHGEGVVHRDIKPANLFLRTDGRAALLDFGVARDLERSAMTLDNQLVGTLLYMAPEQLTGTPADTTSDVYGVGLVLYEAATGQRLHGAPADIGRFMADMASGRLPPPIQGERLSEDMRRVLTRCCARKPADRPRDGAALAGLLAGRVRKASRAPTRRAAPVESSAVETVNASSGVSSPAKGPASRPSRVVCAAAAAVLVLGVLAWTGRQGAGRSVPGGTVEPLEWVQWTDGVELTLASPSGGEVTWRVTGEGLEPRGGRVSGEKGAARVAVTNLPARFRGSLQVEAGSRSLGSWEVALPEHDFAEPAHARFGPSWVDLAWRLHGQAALTLEVEPEGGAVERRRVRSDVERFEVALVEGRSRETAWRLLRGDRVLASGTGLVGLGLRTTLARLSGLPELVHSLALPPASSQDEILIAVDPSLLASLHRVPSPSGGTLAVGWAVSFSRSGLEPWALGQQVVEGMKHALAQVRLLEGGDCLVVSRGRGGYVGRLRGALRRAAYVAAGLSSWRPLVEGPALDESPQPGEPRVDVGAKVDEVAACVLGRDDQAMVATLGGPSGARVEPWLVSTLGGGLTVARGEALTGAGAVLGLVCADSRFAVVWTLDAQGSSVLVWTVDCRAPGGPRVVARHVVGTCDEVCPGELRGGAFGVAVGPRRTVVAVGRALFVVDLGENGEPAVGRVDVELDESSLPQSIHLLEGGAVAAMFVRRVHSYANLPSRIESVVLERGGTGPGGYTVAVRPLHHQVYSGVNVISRTGWRSRGDRLWAMPYSTLVALGAGPELVLRHRADLVGADNHAPLALTRDALFAFMRGGFVAGCDLDPVEGEGRAGR